MPYPVYLPVLGTAGECTSHYMAESGSFHNHSMTHLVPWYFLNKALSFQVLPHTGLHQAGCWLLSFPISFQVKALQSSQNQLSSQRFLGPPVRARAAHARVGVRAKPWTSNYGSLKVKRPFSGPKGQELVDVPFQGLGLKLLSRGWHCSTKILVAGHIQDLDGWGRRERQTPGLAESPNYYTKD